MHRPGDPSPPLPSPADCADEAQAAVYARLAAEGLDRSCGNGFAAGHPQLVADFVQAWMAAERVEVAQETVARLRHELAVLGVR